MLSKVKASLGGGASLATGLCTGASETPCWLALSRNFASRNLLRASPLLLRPCSVELLASDIQSDRDSAVPRRVSSLVLGVLPGDSSPTACRNASTLRCPSVVEYRCRRSFHPLGCAVAEEGSPNSAAAPALGFDWAAAFAFRASHAATSGSAMDRFGGVTGRCHSGGSGSTKAAGDRSPSAAARRSERCATVGVGETPPSQPSQSGVSAGGASSICRGPWWL
mmetsp:Transcript_112878/g.326052  ORF Transcript_112878/g.326052 Transcript_112878/m.326052 type:complete len:223 (-) Transcript_112878:1061-1729(-)